MATTEPKPTTEQPKPEDAKADAKAPAEDKPIDYWDPALPPEKYVGVRIVVAWSGGRWYAGVIDVWDERKKEHHVHYDDNDKRWYDLNLKTFKIEGSDRIYYGETQTGYGNWRPPWTPYTAKDPASRTLVGFHCMIDSRNLLETDSILAHGTPEQLGGFVAGQRGLRLTKDARNPNIWSGEVVLPFAPLEYCATGVLEFKFALDDGTNVFLEGSLNRREKRLLTNFFGCFIPEAQAPKMRGWSVFASNAAFESFADREVDVLFQKVITPPEFLVRFSDLSSSFDDAVRDNAEELFNRQMLNLPAQGPDRALFMLCLLGAVGSFGLTSIDRLAAKAPAVGYPTVWKDDKPVPPKKWCWWVLKEFPNEECFTLDMKATFGQLHCDWPVRGLREAAERIYEDGFFEWLRVSPFLSINNELPKPVGGGGFVANKKDVADRFDAAAAELRQLAIRAFEVGYAQKDELKRYKEAEEKKGNVLSEEEIKRCNMEPTLLQIGRAYLRALVLYCPYVDSLARLFSHQDVVIYSRMLIPEVSRWVAAATWKTAKELETLYALLQQVPDLCCPQVAAGLLRSESMMDPNLETWLFHFVKTIAEPLATWDSVIATLKEGEEKKGEKAAPGVVDFGHPHLVDFHSAVKGWFRAQHAKDEEGDKDKDNWKDWTWSKDAYGNWKQVSNKPPPTPGELAVKRLESLEGACKHLNILLDIPFFGLQSQGLLFELSRCHFLKGDHISVLQGLCELDCKHAKGLGVYTERLRSYLMAAGSKIIEETVPALVDNPTKLLGLVETLEKYLPKTSNLSHTFLYSLVAATGETPPSLDAILRLHYMWFKIYQARGVTPEEWACGQPESQLSQVLGRVHAVLVDTAVQVRDGTIALRDMHTVLKNPYFLKFLDLLKCQIMSDKVLVEQTAVLELFDVQLAQVQCYVNFYCNCGVPINADELRKKTIDLTKRYQSLAVEQVKGSFTALMQEHGTSLAWLYSLRSSELFLNLWRRTGAKCLTGAFVDFKDDGQEPPEENKSEVKEEKEEKKEDPNKPRSAQNEFDSDLARAKAEELKREQQENMVLTQTRVVKELIPAVKRAWRQLKDSVKDHSIPITRLEETFAMLATDAECVTELKTLALTGDGEPPGSRKKNTDWIDESAEKLRDFLLLVSLKKWLPALLRIRTSLELYETMDPKDDAYYQQLQAVLAKMNNNWDAQTLASLSVLVAPVKSQVLGYSKTQLDLITVMAECDELNKWLLEHNDTNEFNRLLEVCRPCTDEPRMLSSIASLVRIRTLLIPIFYVKTKYSGLTAFMDHFKNTVKMEGEEDLWNLKNIQASFDSLLEVFMKQNRSSGVQACYDVLEIFTEGALVFHACSDENAVLVLQMKKKVLPPSELKASETKTESKEAKTDDASMLFAVPTPHAPTYKTEPLEYLLDLRSKLMMMEVPDQIDEETNVRARVEQFILQLQVFCEMRDQIIALYGAGHFDYQEQYTRRFSLTLEGLPALQKELNILKADFARWQHIVRTTREKYYFLNYFTMREILKMIRVLGEAKESEDLPPDGPPKMSRQDSRLLSPETMDPLTHIISLLHLIATSVAADQVQTGMDLFSQLMRTTTDRQTGFVLQILGQVLDSVFRGREVQFRPVPPPGARAAHRADTLISVSEESERTLPVWIACAESPGHVIDVVLSVFVRRGRLPEPGEILFCTKQTKLEDIQLLFRRFIFGKLHNRGDFIFCVADVHALTYTMQCAVVDTLRGMLGDYGSDQAASLLLVSGQPRQVILNSLSSHSVELPPLDELTLQEACRQAFKQHCGETLCIGSSINGGGKTHFLMKTVANRQASSEDIYYRRIPFRENTSAATLVASLSAIPSHQKTALHIDIGHIIPPEANTLLFQLLIVGVLKADSRVYHRKNQDVFYLEIPNSRREKTAKALRFCSLLPFVRVDPSELTLDLTRPVFVDKFNTRLTIQEYREMVYVCKYLRAWEAKKFKQGSLDAEYDPDSDKEVKPDECYKMLLKYTAPDGVASFAAFFNFLAFMYPAFQGVHMYEVFQGFFLQAIEGLENLKHVFIELLIETSKDFALRSVPRGKQYLDDEDLALPNLQLQRQSSKDLNQPPALARAPSAEYREAMEEAFPPEMTAVERQLSDDLAHRFANMKTWEETEHPVVVFYRSPFGLVEAMDIFSLNPHFTNKYIKGLMKDALMHNQVKLNRDWKDLKSEQAIEILRKVEGHGVSASRPVEQIDPTYVLTIDNLLKMLSILLRLKNHLPVMIMGETGCGKSSLIRELTSILGLPLRTLNIHGGMEDADVTKWMQERILEADEFPGEPIVVFLDEVNTCNSMGLFKEILCDRSMNGIILPANLKVIAACNPYRLKKGLGAKEENMAGLIFEHHAGTLGDNVGTGITDPLKNLVYRVHPLPESMVDHVFDFGALAPKTERLYIKAMLRRQLAMYVTEEEDLKKEEEERKKKEEADKQEAIRLSKLDERERRNAERRADAAERRAEREARRDAQREAQREARQARLDAGEEEGNEGDNNDDDNHEDDNQEDDNNDQDGDHDNEPEGDGGQRDNPFWGGIGRLTQAEQLIKQQQLLKSKWEELTPFGEFVEVFADLICAAQEFVRRIHGGERSVVSLRDVARCVKVYKWFGEQFAKGTGEEAVGWTLQDFFNVKPVARGHVRRAVILSLAYCYHARLPRDQRKALRQQLYDTWRDLQRPLPAPRIPQGFGTYTLGASGLGMQEFYGPMYGPRAVWLDPEPASFNQILKQTQTDFVKYMNLGEGIALNEALLENLFMVLVSILNFIPIFVVGKPGSSKSLAMGLIQSNLNGAASDNDWLRSLPAVEVFSYQCSPLSTSQGIEQAFWAAERYKKDSANTVAVVLLDEVGLAEQSPHLPLKVLHKVLDEGVNQAVVGISNWALDPAKMNRAVHLYRPAPTVQDLSNTAEGMVRSANLKGYLQSLARAYSQVYDSQQQEDFWGLREFYSTVKYINSALQASATHELDGPMVMNAVLRNFGGKPREIQQVLDTFFNSLGINVVGVPRLGIVELTQQNLASQEARHMMLLTKNNAALALLFDNELLTHQHTEVIFGSDFPLDQTDLQVCLNIQRVKLCMAEGITVVLVHSESLYESLYDLLNQHYTEYGGQRYVRLAFGTSSRLCPVHKEFRIVVVVEKLEAYTRLAPPLLNRFEKQVMERQHLLNASDRQIVARLKDFTALFAQASKTRQLSAAEKTEPSLKSLRTAFCGFHSDILSSLAQSLRGIPDIDTRFHEAIRRLMWVATPEAACGLMGTPQNNEIQATHKTDPTAIYFNEQNHNDLPSFAEQIDSMSDGIGAQIVLLTFCPLTFKAAEVFRSQTKWKKVNLCVLHELSSERDLTQTVKEYFEDPEQGSVFLLQCDPMAASMRRIEHAKYILEHARVQYAKMRKEAAAAQSTSVSLEEGSEGPPLTKPPTAENEGKLVAEGKTAGDARGVHVVVLIHLPRDEAAFCFDFDLRWSFAFIDSVEPAMVTGLPNMKAMLGQSMADVIGGLNLRQVLVRNFRVALARLVYLHERTNEDVKNQILFILRSLQEGGDSEFVSVVQTAIQEMVKVSDVALDLLSNELTLAGTFQSALHRQISETVAGFFAVVLAHMDRNSNLYLCNERSSGIRELWFYLFHRSVVDMHLYTQGFNIRIVEVGADGAAGFPFIARFPFSFFISRSLESMRATAEGAPGETRKTLAQQFKLLNFKLSLDEQLPEALLQRYAYDFTCMHCHNITTMDRELQSSLLWKLLVLFANNEPLCTLPEIHGRYWECEATLHAYFQLLDSVPGCRTGVCDFIMNRAKVFGTPTNLPIVQIVIESMLPQNQQWKTFEDYAAWMAQYNLARPTIQLLMPTAEEKKDEAVKNAAEPVFRLFEKLQFYFTFVRDIAAPLRVVPTHTLHMISQLSDLEVRTHSTLNTLIKLLSDLNREYSREDKDVECAICLCIPENPVRFCGRDDCSKMLCQNCADDYMRTPQFGKQKTCLLCKRDDAPKYITRPDDIPLVALARSKEEQLRGMATRFMEFFIFDFCFSSLSRKMEEKLLLDFIYLLSERNLEGMSERYFIKVVPSMAGRVALLRNILALNDDDTRGLVRALLLQELKKGVTESGFLDTPLAVCYAAVHEETQNVITAPAHAVEAIKEVAVENLVVKEQPRYVHKSLEAIAVVRRCLIVYAERLCALVDAETPTEAKSKEMEDLVALSHAMNPLLSSQGKGDYARTIRMFLLKQMERRRGVSFVRSALQQAPLSEMPWWNEWKQSAETGLVRFLGENKLPRHNPMTTLPLWEEFQEVVGLAVGPTGGVKMLEAAVRKHGYKKGFKAALLAVVFHEVFLLQVLPDLPNSTKENVRRLQDWLSSSEDIQERFSEPERALLLFFATKPTAVPTAASEFLTLTKDSTPERIAMVRTIAHLAAVSMSAKEDSILCFFRSCMFNPATLDNTWLPVMPEDVQAMAVRVLGGRWYKCPNGHAYYVDLCGRPTVIQKCATCGVEIGGTDHNLLNTNADLDDELKDNTQYSQKTKVKDQSERRYCLRSAEEEGSLVFDTVRSLPPVGFRSLRFLFHAGLALGAVCGGETWTKDIDLLINKSLSNPDNVAKHFVGHLVSSWDMLGKILRASVDDVALLVHCAIVSMAQINVDEIPDPRDELAKVTAMRTQLQNMRTQMERYRQDLDAPRRETERAAREAVAQREAQVAAEAAAAAAAAAALVPSGAPVAPPLADAVTPCDRPMTPEEMAAATERAAAQLALSPAAAAAERAAAAAAKAAAVAQAAAQYAAQPIQPIADPKDIEEQQRLLALNTAIDNLARLMQAEEQTRQQRLQGLQQQLERLQRERQQPQQPQRDRADRGIPLLRALDQNEGHADDRGRALDLLLRELGGQAEAAAQPGIALNQQAQPVVVPHAHPHPFLVNPPLVVEQAEEQPEAIIHAAGGEAQAVQVPPQAVPAVAAPVMAHAVQGGVAAAMQQLQAVQQPPQAAGGARNELQQLRAMLNQRQGAQQGLNAPQAVVAPPPPPPVPGQVQPPPQAGAQPPQQPAAAEPVQAPLDPEEEARRAAAAEAERKERQLEFHVKLVEIYDQQQQALRHFRLESRRLQDQLAQRAVAGAQPAPVSEAVPANLPRVKEDKWTAFRVVEERGEWESAVYTRHIQPFMEGDTSKTLEAAYKKYGPKENEGSVFVAELLERGDYDAMEVSVRAQTLPALWRFRRPFSLEDFTLALSLTDKKYPVLSTFLTDEPQMRALRYIPGLVNWQRLLLNRYNRRLDQATARTLTIGEVLDTAGDKIKWETAWAGFRDAWNLGWPFVERFNCTEIPKMYKEVRMTRETPVVFCLPGEKDEGICPLQLCRFLGEQHNRFVERVDELLLLRGEELQRSTNTQTVVSSKFFAPAHALDYDLHGQYLPYVEKQCLTVTRNGQCVYDFKNAEQYLMDVFFSSKPLIDLEVRMFQYTNGESEGVSLLRQKVSQELLDKETMDQILKELGSKTEARKCMELLETCISFLQATGGSFIQHLDVGEKTLGQYTKEVLMMEHAEFGSNIVSSQVRLKHIDSLWKLLRDYTVVDHFANVRPKYRQILDEPRAVEMLKDAKFLDLGVLLPLMKELITGPLTSDLMGANIALKDAMGNTSHMDTYLMDLPWFADYFPADLPMSVALDVYKRLEAVYTA